ncbi:MAG: MBL fold metallo-hydrolase [Syntrophobacterales bacterium]|nr:MBL fold metallo-hydrolase [Syntrophobacterales bacterium]
MKAKKKTLVVLSLLVIAMLYFGGCVTPKFGRAPEGEILEKIKLSPNYRDGKFVNHAPRIPREGSFFKNLRESFSERAEDLKPSMPLPSVKTNLIEIDRKEDVMVWIGNSSLFIQIDGVRFLIDPVLFSGSPVPFFNKPFPGSEIYKPEDIPDIDYLLISHDHWDHLDYKAVKRLKNRIGKVICGLGVGEHFRQWKFNTADIVELDWNESITLKEGIILHILPSQHYSGRASFGSDNTLWVSFMIEAQSSNIYLSGDTGYGNHFQEIGQQFQEIDIAVLEFGQYGYKWRDIHLMPDDLPKAINDLTPKRVFTNHHAKYALARHSWKEPLEIISRLNEQENLNIITPMMGELVYLNDFSQIFTKWWENIK